MPTTINFVFVFVILLNKFISRWKQALWNGKQQVQVREELLDERLVSIISITNQPTNQPSDQPSDQPINQS